jgi:hypothetical protein
VRYGHIREGETMLRRVLRKCNVDVWAETRGSEGLVAVSCEQGNEPRVSIKVANFFSR